MNDKKHFLSFNKTNFHICLSNHFNSQFSSADIRSIILNDDMGIESLFKLYRFYEQYSEPVS